jgi:outer membrane PBP1 activator LpoA protein
MFTSIAAPRRRSNSRVTLRIVGLALAGALILAGCSTSTPTTSTSTTQDSTATDETPQDDAQTLLLNLTLQYHEQQKDVGHFAKAI